MTRSSRPQRASSPVTADQLRDGGLRRDVETLTSGTDVTLESRGSALTVIEGGQRYFTPRVIVILALGMTDLLFALDSIPAIYGLTNAPYIVFTANAFAILGLRALYFALAAMVDRFAYLKTALAFILIFIGTKIVVADTFELVHVPAWVSLAVTLVFLAAGISYSLWRTRGETAEEAPPVEREAHRA